MGTATEVESDVLTSLDFDEELACELVDQYDVECGKVAKFLLVPKCTTSQWLECDACYATNMAYNKPNDKCENCWETVVDCWKHIPLE